MICEDYPNELLAIPEAVTCDDFRAALADANNVPDGLAQFENWYSQAGTPEIVATPSFDGATGVYSLELTQSCAPSPGQQTKLPYHIPVAVGLIDSETGADLIGTQVLELREASHTFTFELGAGKTPPVLSLLRDFSAPVKATIVGQTKEDLAFLMASDSDSFVRWDSGQALATDVILGQHRSNLMYSSPTQHAPALDWSSLTDCLCS